jgi:hypothetical protein
VIASRNIQNIIGRWYRKNYLKNMLMKRIFIVEYFRKRGFNICVMCIFFLSSSAIVLLTSSLVATIDSFRLTPFATPLNAIFGAISSDILMAPFVGLLHYS